MAKYCSRLFYILAFHSNTFALFLFFLFWKLVHPNWEKRRTKHIRRMVKAKETERLYVWECALVEKALSSQLWVKNIYNTEIVLVSASSEDLKPWFNVGGFEYIFFHFFSSKNSKMRILRKSVVFLYFF